MPIKIQSDLPAKAELEEENIFVMDENRAISQNIRPLEIIVLNLMPIKQDTELQLLRGLSNTPLQIDVTFLQMSSHVSKNTSASHIKKFYQTFEEIKNNNYDGMIITGAPVEKLEWAHQKQETMKQHVVTLFGLYVIPLLLLTLLDYLWTLYRKRKYNSQTIKNK